MRRSGHFAIYLAFAAALILPCKSAGQTNPSASASTVESHLSNGYEALRQDRYDAAAKEFRAALQEDPKLTLRARFPLAVALFEMHRFDEARQELEAVRSEAGDHPNISYYAGRIELEQHSYNDAVRDLNEAVQKPPFPDTAYYLGFAYLKQNNLQQAETWLKKAAEAMPSDARVQYQLGFVYRREGKEEDAKKAFAASDRLRQRDAEQANVKAECEKKLQESPGEEAHAFCDQLYDPDNPEKLTALGTIYGQHGDPAAALKPFRRAAELSSSPQVQYNLALAYFQLNRFQEARGPLETALQRWPDLFQLNALYGAVLAKLGDDVKAAEALRRAHQLNPQDAPVTDLLYQELSLLASAAEKEKRLKDSERYLLEAAQLRPVDPEPHRRLAKVYQQIGQSAQAEKEANEADRLSR